jgi:hypothetical protein
MSSIKKYFQSDKGKAALKRAQAKYKSKPDVKVAIKIKYDEYKQRPEVQQRIKEYKQTPQFKLRYQISSIKQKLKNNKRKSVDELNLLHQELLSIQEQLKELKAHSKN